MTIQSWLIYLTFVFIATSTPGPAALFIVTNSTLHGWKKSVFAALGNIAGLLCLGIIAVTGLGTLLEASEILFDIIKYFGSAYLIYLGVKMLLKNDFNMDRMNSRIISCDVSTKKIFLQAFGVAMSNPKAIVFLTALLPQFMNIHTPLVPQFLILIIVLMLFSFSFLMLYALLAYRIRSWFFKPERMKTFNRTGGSIFVCFGTLLALSTNK